MPIIYCIYIYTSPPLQVPVVSRPEQLGTDDKNLEKDKVDEEEDDKDFEPEEINPEDLANGKPVKVKGRAKAKARAKAKTQSKAMAAKPKRAAKAKPSPGKKKRVAEAAVKDCQERAKKHCKTLPTGEKEPEPAAAQVEIKENNTQETVKETDVPDPKAKENEAEKPSRARKSRRTSNPNPADQSSSKDGADKARKDGDEAQATTSASRYMPEDEVKAARFWAIRDVFVESVASKLKSQSRYQERGCAK